MPAKPAFYAVKQGRTPGIYPTWAQAEAQVRGFPSAKFQKFPTRAEALSFISASFDVFAPAPSASGSKKRTVENEEREGKRIKRDERDSKSGGATADSSSRRVYCDGSALGNGKKGSKAGIGVCWSNNPNAPNLAERLPGPIQTNNRAEMFALARILETDPNPELPLTVCSDSEYTINVFTSWITKWQRNNFKTAPSAFNKSSASGQVSHIDLIKYILSLIKLRPASLTAPNSLTANIKFEKVLAHSNIWGNEQADGFAKAGALKEFVQERDYARDTERNGRRKKGVRSRSPEMELLGGRERLDEMILSFEVDCTEADILTPEELRAMEEEQNF